MKFLVLLCAVATVARGAHVVAPVGVVSQYHAQDELGQYSYGYSGGPSAKYESRTADGVTRGGYSYVDAHGIVQSANYVSDAHNGFRVAATDIPVGPSPPSSVPDALPVVPAAVAPAVTSYHAVAPAVTSYHAVAPAVSSYHAVAPAVTSYQAVVPAISAYHAVAPAVHILKKRALYPAHYAPRGFSYSTVSTHVAHPYVAAYAHPYVAAYAHPYSAITPVVHYAAGHPAVLGRKRRDLALIASAPVAYSPLSPVSAYSALPPVSAYSALSPVSAYSPLSPVSAYSALSPVSAYSAVAHSVVAPVAHAAPVAIASPVVTASSQYHAQDELGQYSYGYSGGPSAKHESRTADGVTRGGYSYVDSHGLVQSASYVADAHNGFRVAATNLPVH